MRSCAGVVVIRQCAAGVTWTLVTAKAPWAARYCHTAVIDAAGAIYVIGGADGNGILQTDVWVSADKGADRTQGLLKGYLGVLNVCSRAQVTRVPAGCHFAHVPQVRRGLAARPTRSGLPDGVTRP